MAADPCLVGLGVRKGGGFDVSAVRDRAGFLLLRLGVVRIS